MYWEIDEYPENGDIFKELNAEFFSNQDHQQNNYFTNNEEWITGKLKRMNEQIKINLRTFLQKFESKS